MSSDPTSVARQKEVRRRRTFAIISHPDAGKTTLTEKLLLFSGAIQIAGSVGGTVGVAAYPDDGQSAEELVRHADADMYERKRIGKAARGEPSRW